PASALVAGGLVLVEELDRPFLTRPLRVPDRVTQHLLGTDGLDPALASLVAGPQTSHAGDADALARAIGRGARLCYLRGRPARARRPCGDGVRAGADVGGEPERRRRPET